MSSNSYISAPLPLLILIATSIVLMIAIAIKRSHRAAAIISFAGLALSFVSLWPASSAAPVRISSLLIVDQYALVYMALVLMASAAVVLLSYQYLACRSEHQEEFYLLLLLATVG